MSSIKTSKYSVLLLGGFYDNHMIRFVRNLKRVNPNAVIDAFTLVQVGKDVPDDYLSCYREYKIVNFPSVLHKIPFLRSLEIIYYYKKQFRTFINGRHYDIVNIHFPSYLMRYILKDLRSAADNIVVTPWGSDVYRISERKRKIVQNVFDVADYVTGHGDRFTHDFMRIFNIPQHKFVYADIGSETIDYIVDNGLKCSTSDAKKKLGIGDSYVITCGYNASRAQQHKKIIEAVERIKQELPSNLVLIFPLTYPDDKSYVNELRTEVAQMGIKALFFTEYLDLSNLLIVRQATDMFVHVQTTDANSASLKEYLLLGKNCINGSWLLYDDIEEKNYKPYYTVNSLDSLHNIILKAFRQGPVVVKEDTLSYIKRLGCAAVAQNWNDFFISISR